MSEFTDGADHNDGGKAFTEACEEEHFVRGSKTGQEAMDAYMDEIRKGREAIKRLKAIFDIAFDIAFEMAKSEEYKKGRGIPYSNPVKTRELVHAVISLAILDDDLPDFKTVKIEDLMKKEDK